MQGLAHHPYRGGTVHPYRGEAAHPYRGARRGTRIPQWCGRVIPQCTVVIWAAGRVPATTGGQMRGCMPRGNTTTFLQKKKKELKHGVE